MVGFRLPRQADHEISSLIKPCRVYGVKLAGFAVDHDCMLNGFKQIPTD